MAITNASKLASYVGAAITADGASGIVTATQFVGDGSNLIGISNLGNATAGVVTANQFSGNITGTAATFTGNVTVGGTLTYDDVTNIDSLGIITARSGVSIADSIFHTGDTNTAIRFPAADTFTVETGGSERVRVTGIGSVGIGENDPANELVVKTGGSPTIEINGQGRVASLTLGVTASESKLFEGSNNDLAFGTNNTERLRIDSSGRVGIGTTSPGNYSGAATQLSISASGNSGLNIVSGTASQGIIRFADGTTGDAAYRGRVEYMHDVDALMFGTAGAERLRITSTGGVHFNNAELIERVNITAGKLSDNTTINLDNGMVHYFTTTETTTAIPNITTTAGINTNMATGDTMSVTIITTAATAGYSTGARIDAGATLPVLWNGGSDPSEGGSSGVDVYVYQVIKTGDAAFTVLGNVSNFA